MDHYSFEIAATKFGNGFWRYVWTQIITSLEFYLTHKDWVKIEEVKDKITEETMS